MMVSQRQLRKHFERATGVKSYRTPVSRADTLLFTADVPEDMSVLSPWLKQTGLRVICRNDVMYVISS